MGAPPLQAPGRPFPTQTLQHSSNSPHLPLFLRLWVMWWQEWDELRLQTCPPNPQGSGLFHSHWASQSLNHFALHYKKSLVFLHPRTQPPFKTIASFNHLDERMFACSEVSTVMSPLQRTHTPTHPWCTFNPCSSQSMPRNTVRGTFIHTDTECLLLRDVAVHVTVDFTSALIRMCFFLTSATW